MSILSIVKRHSSIILTEASAHVKDMIRQREALVWIIILPVILCLLCNFLIAAVDPGEYVLYVQDQDDTNVSRYTVNQLRENVKVVQLDSAMPISEAKEIMSKEENAVGLLIIPNGYKEWFTHAIADFYLHICISV